MQSVKLSVTVTRHLQRKYDGAALRKIERAVKDWVRADAAHGVKTIHVAVDDAAAMRALGVRAVWGRVTANKIKRAVDALWKRLKPDYLVLFGGDDIVPHFVVPNPSYDPRGDDDRDVPTDNPYATATAFRRSRLSSYLVPDRVVGRIPDMAGDGDPAWLLDYLAVASAWASESRSAYGGAYAICCDAWKGAGEDCMREIGEPVARLMISPPETDTSAAPRARLASRLHMIKCHGAQLDPNFYGQRGNSYPVSLASDSLRRRLRPHTLAAAMCCYGAQVYSPADPAATEPGKWPLASSYLRGGAWGFVGSTMIAWVGVGQKMCADWIVTAYLKGVLAGASLGRAFLESKQDYMRWISQQGGTPDLADEKTLIEFVLLGDPSIHPVGTTAAIAAAAPRGRRAAMAARPSTLAAQERLQRRIFRSGLADQIREILPERTTARGAAVARKGRLFAAVRAALKEDPRAFGILPRHARVEVVETRLPAAAGPAPARRGRAGAAVRSGGKRRSLEYYWSGRRVKDGHKQIRLIKVETDLTGRVVRSTVVHSS